MHAMTQTGALTVDVLSMKNSYLHAQHMLCSRYIYAYCKQQTLSQGWLLTSFYAVQVMYAVCSGSEANDLALRVARATVAGAWHVAVMQGAYHGHTTATLDLSPYKFDGPGGTGQPPHVHVLPCPDVYRYGCPSFPYRSPPSCSNAAILPFLNRLC